MFPGSPRARDNAKVIPLGARSRIALTGDDSDLIVLEVFDISFSTSTITLPNTAPIGKVFRFALTTHPALNPSLTTEYVDIIVPLPSGVGILNIWRMFSGQRPSFTYTPNGWLPDGGYDISASGTNNNIDVAYGSHANASNLGVAVGYFANGNSFGVAVGWNASGSNNAAAVGYAANGTEQGAAIGRSANGSSSGAAVGRSANGSSSGVAIGRDANGSSFGVAVGRDANGNTNGVAVGYTALTNSMDMAVALGYFSKCQRYRETTKSHDGAATTLRSWSMLGWYGDTVDATPLALLLGGTAAQRLTLLNNSAFQFNIQVIAARTAAGDTSSWEIKGAIKRGANAASTVLVGTPTVTLTGQDTGASAWTIAVTADTTNGCLTLTATGQAATTIRWVASGTISEVRF